MITKWIHFDELGGDPWVLPIYAAANKAEKEGKYPALSATANSLGLHIATRLNVLPRVIRRLNTNCLDVYEKIKEHKPENIFTNGQAAYTFALDSDLKYTLIGDIDSFLFEVNACAELITEFAQALYNHVGRPATKEAVLADIQAAYKNAGIAQNWFKLLDDNRNFVAHNGTPYIAVDISEVEKPILLIMKDNVVSFDDPDKYFPISDLQLIADGFEKTKLLLQALLIGLFK